MDALGLMGEEGLALWRRSLEFSKAAGMPPAASVAALAAPLTPPANSLPTAPSPPTSSPARTPLSPAAGERSPSNGSTQDEAALERPTSGGGLTNGGPKGSRPSSEDGERRSPPHMDDSKSLLEKLAKSAGSPPPLTVAGAFPPSMPPHSLASPMNPHSPHHMVMSSLPLPLGMPPFPTGRIPKSDPLEEKLQDMLRYNMEKYAGQHLDTLGMSRRVRELLSIHNIGQRLFAKYVLGLSQGTVSELLSKPKAWEKLTEKGRDSYRKMHAWCYDENAVMMLKSLIPRKGELMRSVPPAPLMMKGKSVIKYFTLRFSWK